MSQRSRTEYYKFLTPDERVIEIERDRIADLDYAKAYENVPFISIGGKAPTSRKPPTKVTIFRMYFLLNNVSLTELLNDSLKDVEELTVIADVVAIDGNEEILLPGTHRVVILCRFLTGWKKDPEAWMGKSGTYIVIRLSLQQNKEIPEGLLVAGGAFRAPQWAPGKPTQLFVFARGVRFVVDGYHIESRLSRHILQFSQHIVNFDKKSSKTSEWSGLPNESGTFELRIAPGDERGEMAMDSLSLYPIPYQGDAKYMIYYASSLKKNHLKEPWLGFHAHEKYRVPSHLLEDVNVVMGVQVTLLSAEAILLYGQGEAAVEGAMECCKWLSTQVLGNRDSVKKGSTDSRDQALRAELQMLYVRATALITRFGGGNPDMLVPPLAHQLYRDMINRIVEAAKLYDAELKETVSQIRILQTTEMAAENVAKAIGGTLMDHFQVLAAKERDMENYIGMVEEQQKADLDEAETKLRKLQTKMENHQKAMTAAKGDIEKQKADYEQEQKAKAAWKIIGTIFSAVAAVVTFGASAGSFLKDLEGLKDGMEQLIEVLEKLEKVMDAVKGFDTLLKSDPGENVDAPSLPEAPLDSDWEIFVNKVEAVVDTIPPEIEAAKLWKTECRNVASIGKDISIVVAQITKLKFDIKVQGWQKDMAVKQRDRLDAVKQTVPTDLDSSSILQEMVVQLDMRNQRMIISLVETLNIQNAALYYNFLQKPESVSIGAPTIHSILQQLIDKEKRFLEWKVKIGKSTVQRAVYVIENIPTQILRSGKDFFFNISVNDYRNFPKYKQRVRILHLEIRFTGENLPTTETGEVYFQLRGDRVFYDRYKGDEFRYEAVTPLKYEFAYNLSTRDPTWENKDLRTEEGTFMQMTPFSNWKLRVPLSTDEDPNENENIQFKESGKTSVVITFHTTVLR